MSGPHRRRSPRAKVGNGLPTGRCSLGRVPDRDGCFLGPRHWQHVGHKAQSNRGWVQPPQRAKLRAIARQFVEGKGGSN